MTKKLRIVSKPRFIFSLVILFLFLSIGFNAVFNLSVVEGTFETEFIEVQVKVGDTLWMLAKTFSPKNQDIRSSIYEISTLNNLTTSSVYPGQILKIPLK